jgi:hypothetical protein
LTVGWHCCGGLILSAPPSVDCPQLPCLRCPLEEYHAAMACTKQLSRPRGRFVLVSVARGLAWLLPLVAASGVARAATIATQEREAKTACLAGDYSKGVAILAELYVTTRDATYIYNQARCFEQNGRYDDAIFRFREYQRKRADAGQPPDASADKHIADCRALLEQQRPVAVSPAAKPAEAGPASAATEPAPVGVPASDAGHESQAADLEVASPRSPSPGTGLRIAGIATAALGIAGVATGVILHLKVNSLANQLEEGPLSYSRNTESTRKSYKTGSMVAYGVGAACLVGGATLYLLGYREGRRAQVAVLPAAGSGQLGLSVQGAF